jgi:hypothetical protein
MSNNMPNAEVRLSLDDGGGPRLMVSPESFAEFDLWVSHGLAGIERRWADYSTPRAMRLAKLVRRTQR